MTSSKGSGVTQEIVAYVLKHQDDFFHYCKTVRCEANKGNLYNWIFANGQSEYSKNAITRAVKKMGVSEHFISRYPRRIAGLIKETTNSTVSSSYTEEERSLYGRGMLDALKRDTEEGKLLTAKDPEEIKAVLDSYDREIALEAKIKPLIFAVLFLIGTVIAVLFAL